MLKTAIAALIGALLYSAIAGAQEWVALRPPAAPGTGKPPQILIDVASIEILASGLRRATSKTNFLGDEDPGQFAPQTLRFAIWVITYDCAKQLTHSESSEIHMVGGKVLSGNRPSSKWYPVPSPAADPAFGYVCEWKGK
jgi:hypothetical protein